MPLPASLRLLTLCAATLLATTLLPAQTPTPTPPAQTTPTLGPHPFIDYFRPIPLHGKLSATAWGAPTVGPRDPRNGLEDPTLAHWNYWDGSILQAPDGTFRLFGSRWDQAAGHRGWTASQCIEAASPTLLGPYTDRGLCWPHNQSGKGHNVTALHLPDGTFAVLVSETRNGDIFTSPSIDGPWYYLGPLTVDQDQFHSLHTPADLAQLHAPNPKPWHGSNLTLLARPDGRFEIVQRSGQVLLSNSGILGPYVIQGDSIYRGLPGIPQENLARLEDPLLWFSGGWYHLIVNHWSDRRAFHLISRDGITHWRFQGIAYEPNANFIRYTNGAINHWNKLERPNVVLAHGHVIAFTLAVIDVPKDQENGNDHHGSKIIVLPFNGAALDKDLATIDHP